MRARGEGKRQIQRKYSKTSIIGQGPRSRLVSACAIGRLLGVSRRTIHRWGATGLIPQHRVGKQWRYVAIDVVGAVMEIRRPQRTGQAIGEVGLPRTDEQSGSWESALDLRQPEGRL